MMTTDTSNGASEDDAKDVSGEKRNPAEVMLGWFRHVFEVSPEKRLKFFEIWEYEQLLLGQVSDDLSANAKAPPVPQSLNQKLGVRARLKLFLLAPLKALIRAIRNDDKDKAKQANAPLDDAYKIPDEYGRGKDPHERRKTLGLALSGGGVRAASFSLGVMQALNRRDKDEKAVTLLDHVDYLSTVSGGGYAGSALTYYRRLARLDPSIFGKDYDCKIKLDQFPKPEAEVLNKNESRMLDFTRFRKNHLTPTHVLNFNAMAATAIRTVLTAWPIYLSFLIIGMYLFYAAGVHVLPLVDEDIRAPFEAFVHWFHEALPFEVEDIDDPQIVLALLVVALSGLLAFGRAVLSVFVSAISIMFEGFQYRVRRALQILAGFNLGFFIGAIFLALTPILVEVLTSNVLIILGFVFGGNALAGKTLSDLRDGTLTKKLFTPKRLFIFSALVIFIGNLMLAYSIARYLYENQVPWPLTMEREVVWWWAGAALAVLGAAAAFLASLNYLSLNRMYRDRLMEAFMPNYAAFKNKDNNQPATFSDRLALSSCNQRPLHLINTNIVLSTSKRSRYRGRSGDSFILAPHFSGSWVTGYIPTNLFSKDPASEDNGVGLATAMSISGAAFSPRVGPSGWDTILRHPLVASVSSFLNLRLGFWVANPNAEKQSKRATFWNAGLRGILNYWFDESRRLVELTDGGHFENTGIFELLRRRVDVIILADASADRAFNFKDIGIAIERARVDQSIDIRFVSDDYDLTHLMPGSAGDTHYDDRYKLAKRGFAVARISYPAFEYKVDGQVEPKKVPAKTGLLFYIKPSVTRHMPIDIYSYKGANEAFPYQPITDQNFDESQFEAYRALGFEITDKMLVRFEKIIHDELTRSDGKAKPDWHYMFKAPSS